MTLSDRIKEDEEAAALLQMEETRRATGRDRLSELPSSLLAHTGSFMEYRQAIAEVAVIGKEFYSACEEHKKCFKKNPFVGIRIQGAGDESGPGPQGFWADWKCRALPPHWYAGPSGRYIYPDLLFHVRQRISMYKLFETRVPCIRF